MKKLIVIGIIATCIWMMYRFPHAMLNPGELMASHQELNEKCLDCHQPFWGIDSKKCITCHTLSDIGKDTTETDTAKHKILFHQNLADAACASCHTEHKGIQPARMVNFSHEVLTAEQINHCNGCHVQPGDKIHLQVAPRCSSCHTIKGWKVSVAFNHDMLQGVDKTNCIACHGVPADGFHTTGMASCLSCHTKLQWKPSSFNHDKYFRFDGNHPSACANCHSGNDFSSYTCYNCHEHGQSKISEEHYEHGISNFANCVSCHRTGNKHEAEGEGTEHHEDREED